MIYCALDQAMVTTGWSIWDDNKLIKVGTFKTKSSASIEERLGQIWKELNNLCATYDFNYLFLEDTQKQTNIETYKKLCYCQAAIILWCYFNDMKFTILSPSHWRKIIKDKYGVIFGRKREEQKAAAQQFVQNQFSLSLGQDEADSVCIGQAGILEYNKNRSAF